MARMTFERRRDWVILGLVAALSVASTVYLFLNQHTDIFVAWGTFNGSILTAYHWLYNRSASVPPNIP